MEDPEIIYCEVIGPAKDAQPKPRQSQKNEDSILELVAANLVRPRRIPAPRTHTVFTSHCTKCDQNSSSKSQVAMRIAVVIILTIWSVAFTVLYFTTNVNIKPCVIEKKHKPFVANNSIVTNCSEIEKIMKCDEFPPKNTTTPNKTNGTDCKMLKKDLEIKKLAYVSLRCIECSEYSILFHRKNTEDYVISNGAPQMTAITACFWVNTSQETQGNEVIHYITYAVSDDQFGKRDNEFGIGRRSNTLEFYVKYNIRTGIDHVLSRTTNIVINDGKWHAICGLWSSKDGEVKIYNHGKLVHRQYAFRKNQFISAGGTWVLGHDQDTLGGGFVLNQMMQGEITEVNIWDRVLSDEEIKSFSSCQSRLQGNVKSWKDFIAGVKGKAAFVQGPTCCKV